MSEQNQTVTDASADINYDPHSARECLSCGHAVEHEVNTGVNGTWDGCPLCSCTETGRVEAELRARINALATQLSAARASAPVWPAAERSGVE